MFSIEDCIIQLATPVSTPGHAPVRFRPPTVRRKREKAEESISRIHMSTKPPYTKVFRASSSIEPGGTFSPNDQANVESTMLRIGTRLGENLPAALLALRTITHDSTGFSPAELIHGKNLRTPEVLLNEHRVRPQEEDSTVTEYIFDPINHMRHFQELAVTTMAETRNKRKIWYDKNAVKREFRVW
ncbi:hypothetical protein AVEN_199261-1 [Araneus ventricosus]|uniref:Uncharacterized protein n=1 Tax=Araneus ventricosus TaxID=182803 RepID=A0A4Y2JYA5_ARAVE|nr:hypothetical protein AVEN_199261-1 [Araneus ventricosus]